MLKRNLLILLFYFFALHCFAQRLVYQDFCRCGITGNGGSTTVGSGTVHFNVLIPSGSSIKKAYLIAYECGKGKNITVTLNGINYIFSNNNIVTYGYISYQDPGRICDSSSIHLIDITSNINPSIMNYNLTIPVQYNAYKGFYVGYYLYIEYQNPALSLVNTALYLNNQDVSPFIHYHLKGLNSINNLFPVGLEIMTTSFCDTILDGSYVIVNNDSIGLIGGPDTTSYGWDCPGPYPNFSYYNDSLIGLEDDTADSLMSGTDVTADIKSYINMNDTALDLYFNYQGYPSYPQGWYSNPIRGVILNYATTCDTFTTTVSADAAICYGDSAQLWATGGVSTGSTPAYKWQPSYGLSCDTCASPTASPDSSVTYTVRIYHNDSCSKVLPVRVLVYKTHPQISVTPASCGDSNGAVTFTANNAAQYYLGNQHNTSGIFNNFPSGAYPAHITDSLGCIVWQDTVHIGFTNNALASFLFTPLTGNAPLTITTGNYSNHTNQYTWIVNGDTVNSINLTHTFDSAGTYNITLIACHNSYPCCDTAIQTIRVGPLKIDSTHSLVIPNVFTPNGDGINDVFIVKMKNVKSGSMQIYNRWGTAISATKYTGHNLTLKWNGKTAQGKSCSAGTYYYVVTYETSEGKTKTTKGYVTLLR